MASWFKHIGGVLVLGVELPDGSAATVPAAVTDVFGAVVVQEQALVLDADGLRGLRALTARLLESAQGVDVLQWTGVRIPNDSHDAAM